MEYTGRAYRFSPNASAEPPIQPMNTAILERAWGDTPLTRAEKDKIAELMYGLFSANGPGYMCMGWCWPMNTAPQMFRFLVAFSHEPGTFRAYYTGDEKALRHVLKQRGPSVAEIVKA